MVRVPYFIEETVSLRLLINLPWSRVQADEEGLGGDAKLSTPKRALTEPATPPVQ